MGEGLLKILLNWVQYWKTKRGLIVVAILIFTFFTLLLFPGLAALDLKPSTPLKTSTISIAELIWLIVWFVKSYRIPFFGKHLRIAIRLDGLDSTEEDKREIQQQILKQASYWDMGNKINFVELPKDVKFLTPKEAEDYVWKRNLDLLIWGDIRKGNVSAQEMTAFKFNFTYNYLSPADNRVRNMVAQDVALALMNRRWYIRKQNSLIDVDIVAKNVLEASTFIVGLCLLSWSRNMKAIELFEKTLANVSNGKEFQQFRERLREILHRLYHIEAEITRYTNNDNGKFNYYLKRMLELYPSSLAANLGLARSAYLDGNIKIARQYTNDAEKFNPKNKLPLLNHAFFAILDKQYDKGLKLYKQVASLEFLDDAINVVLFLEDEYKNHQDEPALLFAAGLVNYHFCDKNRGKRQLRRFEKIVNRGVDPCWPQRYGLYVASIKNLQN
ncbi:MAG: hypothetical protein L0Y74_10490 [candidate division Zixibacteria bacterium]|nr:hypothetical protein [candidate division Zixibacteria bacterium]